MVDKYDDDPPAYDSLPSSSAPPPEKITPPGTSTSPPRPSWRSLFSSSSTAKQVRQTVLALVRDLVLNADSPDLLDSCANACRSHRLDLSALLQEPFIERHSPIYWAILNSRDALLPSLLVHAAPLSYSSVSEIRLACLVTANQDLFQALRCRRRPFTMAMTPLSTSPGADALVLGSLPTDEVSIRESEGQGAFVAEMHFNLWQKRMRMSGRVSVEFIARGRIWSLAFFSRPSTMHTTAGIWCVALSLLEHSPPTFVDSRLIIDTPSSPSELVPLSPSPGDQSGPVVRPSLPSHIKSSKSKSKSKPAEVRLKADARLAYRASYFGALPRPREWSPPQADLWYDDNGKCCTSAIVVPLGDGDGAQLMYEDSPFIADDGALHARLEARLEKPEQTECIIC